MFMTPECVAPTGCLLGEGAVWSHTEGFLWWVDNKRAKLHRYNPKTGNTRRYDLPIHAASLALFNGHLLMAGDREIGLFDPATELYDKRLDLTLIPASHRINDGGIAPDGSFWFATTHGSAQEASGQYYALSPEFQVSVLRLPPVIVPNSLVFSPEGNVFYTCDTVEQEILAHDYSIKGGALSGRRVLASTFDIGGLPDGACIDEEGGLWVCLYDASRVVRFLPSGEIDETITLAAPRPTDCAIGGPDMRTLFITTARVGMSFMQLDARPLSGSLFATEIKVRGVRARGFGETGTLM